MKRNELDIERVSELVIDEWIWVIFIILSILNISGDELEKKYCFDHEEKAMSNAKKIFKLTVFVSFLIYFYLAYKNCKKFHKFNVNNRDTKLIGTRCFASILVVVASFLFLTVQLKDEKTINPSIQ